MTRGSRTQLWAVLAMMLLGAAACGRSVERPVGGETNWLRECSSGAACGAEGSCVCGLCSEGCQDDDECPSGLVCKSSQSALVTDACGRGAEMGLCAPECERHADCASGQRCVEQACAPDPSSAMSSDSSTGGAAGATSGGGLTGAYVVAALSPDAACNYAADSDAFVAVGQYDLLPGGNGNGNNCETAYRVHLELASYARDVLQMSGAEIELMTIDQQTIIFDRFDPPLPNPFTFNASRTLLPAPGAEATEGVVALELIPLPYAEQLNAFAGSQVLAEVRVQARDADDRPVDFPPFLFPIDICDGCLTLCRVRDIIETGAADSDFIAEGQCDDNAGVDGRLCIDPSC